MAPEVRGELNHSHKETNLIRNNVFLSDSDWRPVIGDDLGGGKKNIPDVKGKTIILSRVY